MKKTVLTLLTAAVIILAAVAFKNVYSCKIPIGNRGIRAAINEGDLDVLFIGSSTFHSNLDIHELDKAYDGRDFIISYGGNQYTATSVQYDEKTDDTPSPGKEFLENEEFDISDSVLIKAQEESVIEIIEKCRRDGQDFIFLECPHYYRLSEDPVYKEYHGYFTDLMVKYDVDYILAGDIDFDDHNPDYFEDMSHMSGMGRKIYTKELVKYLHKAGKETT